MIDRCDQCDGPTVDGECLNDCASAKSWVLFVAFVLSVVVLAVVKGCAKHPDDDALQPAEAHDTVGDMNRLFALTLCLIPAPAGAEVPIPACAWTDAARVELGRMVQLESTSADEYRTFAWALARRWRGRPAVRALTFSRSVTAFSWILRRHRDAGWNGASPRQRWILSHAVPAGVAGELEAWAAGERTDGCRGGFAFDWHSPPRGRFHCPGFNRFYRMPSNVVLEEGHCG